MAVPTIFPVMQAAKKHHVSDDKVYSQGILETYPKVSYLNFGVFYQIVDLSDIFHYSLSVLDSILPLSRATWPQSSTTCKQQINCLQRKLD